VRGYAEAIVRGTEEHREAVDAEIRRTAEHWVMERMAAVDRNILRLAAYELLFRDDIPPAVAINEALEVAKKYSSSESVSFINGVLDKIARSLNREAGESGG
jgi:N utilization substance protein B